MSNPKTPSIQHSQPAQDGSYERRTKQESARREVIVGGFRSLRVRGVQMPDRKKVIKALPPLTPEATETIWHQIEDVLRGYELARQELDKGEDRFFWTSTDEKRILGTIKLVDNVQKNIDQLRRGAGGLTSGELYSNALEQVDSLSKTIAHIFENRPAVAATHHSDPALITLVRGLAQVWHRTTGKPINMSKNCHSLHGFICVVAEGVNISTGKSQIQSMIRDILVRDRKREQSPEI